MHADTHIFWQALRAALEFQPWMLLLHWASPSILYSGICSSISTWYVRPTLQSAEEPSDSWEREHCVNFLCRGTSFLPSLKHEQDPERWRMEAIRSFVYTESGSVTASSWWAHSGPPLRSPVMKDWGGVAVSRQEADNQITQDYVSHLTCMDPVSVLKSVIYIFLSVCVCKVGETDP